MLPLGTRVLVGDRIGIVDAFEDTVYAIRFPHGESAAFRREESTSFGPPNLNSRDSRSSQRISIGTSSKAASSGHAPTASRMSNRTPIDAASTFHQPISIGR